ncbi:MAG: Gx transporter family protein [Treponema sp.]|jgi:heptaprenyl diphosphate synthase|nr:Gx transporter family protein [Treponema sp.]
MTTQSWTARPGKTPRPGNRRTLAILGAFCLFLSTIEYLIPKPVPFMRIGIANLPLMLALDILPFGEFVLLTLIKVAGQGIVTGTLFSYILLFSLTGTFVSALSMYALRRLLGTRLASMAGISALGALLSNGAQLALARLFVFGPSVRYILPPFLAMGVITGTGLGLFCERFIGKSRWYARETSPRPAEDGGSEKTGTAAAAADRSNRGEGTWEKFRRKRQDRYERIFSARDLCAAGLLMMPALVFNPNPSARFLQFLFFSLLLWFAGKKNNVLITIAVMLSIVAFNLLAPYGQALFSIGTFRLTRGALMSGLQRAATLEGLIMLSRFSIRRDLRLPGAFGELIGESFRILASIQERRNAVSRKNFAAGVDALMLELSQTEEPPAAASSGELRRGSSAAGRIILTAAVILSWLPVVISRQ